MKKGKGYYARRAVDKEMRIKRLGDRYLEDLEHVFVLALEGINNDIRRFMIGIPSEDVFKTITMSVDKSELDKSVEVLAEYINEHSINGEHLNNIMKLYNHSKLNRMGLMQLQLRQRLQLIKEYESKGTKEHLADVYKESFYETAHMLYEDETGLYNFEKLNDVDTFIENSFAIVNTKAVEEALKMKYLDKTFIQRIQRNNRNFTDFTYKVFISEVAQGKSIDQITRVMHQHMLNRFSNARTIVRTESNRFNAMGTQKAYEASGLEKYVFIATLDMKTSTLCQNLDQEVFLVKEQKIGVNCNPMHPNCRSTTAPYTESRPFSRTARRPFDNREYTVEGGMKYKDWYESLTKGEKDHIAFLKKSEASKKYDKKQFNAWKKTLKEEAPKTFKSFQHLKYMEREKYTDLKRKHLDEIRGRKRKLDENGREVGRGRNKTGSRKEEAIVDRQNANSKNLKRKFKELGESEIVTNTLFKETRKILKNRDGSRVESLLMINSETGEIATNYANTLDSAVEPTKKQFKLLNKSKEYTIIGLHNHPRSNLPSDSDLRVAWLRKYKYGLIACHDGRIMKYYVDFDRLKTEDDLSDSLDLYRIKFTNAEDVKGFIKKNVDDLKGLGIYIEIIGE